jgi:hypothetical protein
MNSGERRLSLWSNPTCAMPSCEALWSRRGLGPHHAHKDRVGTWGYLLTAAAPTTSILCVEARGVSLWPLRTTNGGSWSNSRPDSAQNGPCRASCVSGLQERSKGEIFFQRIARLQLLACSPSAACPEPLVTMYRQQPVQMITGMPGKSHTCFQRAVTTASL